ncbi:MAG TPA: M23 family metallopeptidase [Spirochaetota bacterium]|nr:M23 family metallopeptidase [Spirochaetota bacterium]
MFINTFLKILFLSISLRQGAVYAARFYCSQKVFHPGDLIMVHLIKEDRDSTLRVTENKQERRLYPYSSRACHRNHYFFFTGFDIKYYPSQVTYKIYSAAGCRTIIKHLQPVSIAAGKVKLKRTQKKKLAAATRRNRKLAMAENKFFHNFFSNESTNIYWEGGFIQPVAVCRLSSAYGKLRTYSTGRKSYHRGVDYAAPTGTSVRAVNRGRVVYAGRKRMRGRIIVIDHGGNLFTTYWHLNNILVQTGSIVEKGAAIGTVGETGLASGPHLHFGVRILSMPVNGEMLWQLDIDN